MYLRTLRQGKVVSSNSLKQYYEFDKWAYQIPTGTVVMFDASCPSGWIQLAAIDDRFVKAAAAYGAVGGGNTNHTHTISTHTHTWTGNTDNTDPTDRVMAITGDFYKHIATNHNHTLSVTNVADGSDTVGNGTNTNERIQPWVKLIFCKKL